MRLQGPELLLILGVVLLLFGGKKLPELAKGLGQGIKEFRSASKESAALPEEKEKEKSEETTS